MSSSSDFALTTYKEMIERHQALLHATAKSALSLSEIPADERKFLENQVAHLSDIDALVKIIENLKGVNRTVAMSSLEKAIFAALVIGSRAVVNPISEKFIQDVKSKRTAHARGGKEPRSKCMLISVHDRTKDLWRKNAIHIGNARGTSLLIWKRVNDDLIAKGYSPSKTEKAVAHVLTKRRMEQIRLEIQK